MLLRMLLVICLVSITELSAKNYKVAICAIFQNDAAFLKEWIEFHKLQGVEHFYLYNNNSSDNYAAVLKPYIKKNEVTLTQWPYTYPQGDTYKWVGIQCAAYNDCLVKYGKDCSWLGFIDSDEFLFCPTGKKLSEFLKDYTSYGGVCAQWVMFGTSEVEMIPEGSLMIELLTRCSYIDRNGVIYIKSIVQPKHVKRVKGAHDCGFKEGYFAVSPDGTRINNTTARRRDISQLRINHYWARTESYFREFKMPSRSLRRDHENENSLQARAASYNKEEDTAILRFVPALKENMFKKSHQTN